MDNFTRTALLIASALFPIILTLEKLQISIKINAFQLVIENSDSILDERAIEQLKLAKLDLLKSENTYNILLIASLLIAGCLTFSLAKSQLSFWRIKQRELKNRERDTALFELLDRFSELNEDQMNMLVAQGLALQDAAGMISLKYICPISKNLISEPIEVSVQDKGTEVDELFDKLSFDTMMHHYPNNLTSPTSFRPFVMSGGKPLCKQNPSLISEYTGYIDRLKQALDSIERDYSAGATAHQPM